MKDQFDIYTKKGEFSVPDSKRTNTLQSVESNFKESKKNHDKTLQNQTIDHNIHQEEISNLINANFPVNPAINEYADQQNTGTDFVPTEPNGHIRMKFQDRQQDESETENYTNNHGTLNKVAMMNPNNINNPDGDIDYEDYQNIPHQNQDIISRPESNIKTNADQESGSLLPQKKDGTIKKKRKKSKVATRKSIEANASKESFLNFSSNIFKEGDENVKTIKFHGSIIRLLAKDLKSMKTLTGKNAEIVF